MNFKLPKEKHISIKKILFIFLIIISNIAIAQDSLNSKENIKEKTYNPLSTPNSYNSSENPN